MRKDKSNHPCVLTNSIYMPVANEPGYTNPIDENYNSLGDEPPLEKGAFSYMDVTKAQIDESKK